MSKSSMVAAGMDPAGAVTPEPRLGRGRRLISALGEGVVDARARRGAISLIAGFGLWELAVLATDASALVVAPPSVIIGRFFELVSAGELQRHLWISLAQFGLGYLGCAAVAVPMGLAIGRSQRLRDICDPWISALYATPSISLAPLFIIWLGFGTTSKAFIIALLAFFPIIINTVDGVEGVTAEYEEVARAFRAGRLEQMLKVVLPGATPYIFTGLRLAVGRGLVGLVVGDLFGSTAGLGHMIIRAAQLFRTADVFVATIVLAMLGVVFTAALSGLQRALIHTPERPR